MKHKQDIPDKIVYALAIILGLALGVESYVLMIAEPSFAPHLTGRQATATVELVFEESPLPPAPEAPAPTPSGGGGGGSRAFRAAPEYQECNLGDVGCRGDHYRLECGNFDADPFLELGVVECAVNEHCVNGACVKLCQEEWECTQWSKCSALGVQTRTCKEINICGTAKLIPFEQRACIPPEAPVFLGVAPFSVTIPKILTTPAVLAATVLLAVLLLLFAALLTFEDRASLLILYMELRHTRALLLRKEYARADEYVVRVVEVRMRLVKLDERKQFHRKLLRMYYEINRDIARYHAQLAASVGERVEPFAKRAEEYARLAEKYREL